MTKKMNNTTHTSETAQSVSDVDTIDAKASKMSIPNFTKDNVFEYHNMAHLLIKHFNIVRLNGVNHIRSGGIYWYDNELIEYAMQRVRSRITPAERKLVLDYLRIATKESAKVESSSEYVAFNNGVLNILTGEFEPFPASAVLTNKLSIDYEDLSIVESSADIELINQLFSEATNNDFKLERYLYFIFACCCTRGILEPTAFILSGANRNDGRNTFVDMIEHVLGNCVVHENLQDLAVGKSSMELYSKTCNISNEQEPPKVNNMNVLRSLICGNKVTDKKSGLEFYPFATIIFNITDILNFDSSLIGLNGYFKVIPFENKLTLDRKHLDKLLSPVNLQYITLKALQVYASVLNSDEKVLTTPDVIERATNQYLLYSNSAKEFLLTNPFLEAIKTNVFYEQYKNWCEQSNKFCFNDSQFGKEVFKFGYKHIRMSTGGRNRISYYVIPNFNITLCREKYLDYLMSHTEYTEINGDRSANGKFLNAFTDYFAIHTLDEDEEIDSFTKQLEDGTKSMEILENMPNIVLEKNEPQ